MNTEIDQWLNETTIEQLCFKNPVMKKIACTILDAHMKASALYTDEIDLSWVSDEDSNCVGTTVRALTMLGLIHKTGEYRRSKTKSRRGGLIWQYTLNNENLAATFLARNSDYKPTSQQNLL